LVFNKTTGLFGRYLTGLFNVLISFWICVSQYSLHLSAWNFTGLKPDMQFDGSR